MTRVFFTGTLLAGCWTTMQAIGRLATPAFDPSTAPFEHGGWTVGLPDSKSQVLVRPKTRTSAHYDMLENSRGDPRIAQEADFVRGADLICYVADSQTARLDANIAGIKSLFDVLVRMGRDPAAIPVIFQLNKRDLPGIVSVDELERVLIWPQREFVPTVAKTGAGIGQLLSTVARTSVSVA